MGICVSKCFHVKSDRQTAKLLDADGSTTRDVDLPLKAAELMLENPGHIVCPVDDLKKSRRLSAMRADDDLSRGKIYLLLTVGRVHNRVSESEIEKIEAACKKQRISKPTGSKVGPEAGSADRRLEKEGEGGGTRVFDSGLVVWKENYHKRWNPELHTISED